VASFAENFTFMLRAVCGIKHLVTHSALEAGLVPLLSTGETLLGSIYRLAAFWAFWVLWRLERHVEGWSCIRK
jgi:hypothetical protein